jgi:hypothetical protein
MLGLVTSKSWRLAGATVAGLALLAVEAVAASDDPLTDMQLYAASSLTGIHAHPIGSDGKRLEAAEDNLNRRRAIIRDWLAKREGSEAVDELDDYLSQTANEVLWSGAVSLEEEWQRIREVRHALQKLERRKRATEQRDN